jgi:hypothetical protein
MSTGFQVQHDMLDTAAGTQVPDQVSALGDTRQALLARKVDPAAFGEVEFSAQAGQLHHDNIDRNASELERSQGRLTKIGQGIRDTTARVRGMDDRQARDQREQNTQLTQVADKELRQRDKALAVLDGISKKNPVSVATVAKRPLEWYTNKTQWSDWLRNVEAGQIGDHYEKDVADKLAEEPTDANLRDLAETETKFWTSDRGSTVGGWFSADWRYEQLVESRTEWLAGMPPAEATKIREQLGLPRD